MKTRKEAKAENNRNFIKKDMKSQHQVSKSQFLTTIEEPELNDSVNHTHSNGYGK